MRKSKRILATLFLVVFSLFNLVSCSEEKKQPDANGFQWKVTKGEDTMYLVGTIHLTNPSYSYINSNISKMLEETDGLGVEVDLSQPTLSSMANHYNYLPEGQTIESQLTAEEIDKLKDICTQTTLPYDTVKTLTPSTLLSTLTSYFYMSVGSNGTALDLELIKKFNSSKKEVIEIEKAEDQFKILGELQNITTLKEFLKATEKGKFEESHKATLDETKELTTAYIEGNEKYLEDQANKMKETDVNSYNKMLKDRNIGMVNKAEEIFNKKGTHIVAVGSLHFFGEDGIVRMLQDRGYNVEKLKDNS